MSIESKDIAHYHEHGYVVIKNFLSKEELDNARRELEDLIPGWIEYSDDPQGRKPNGWDLPERSRRTMRFPFSGEYLNRITLHPDLQAFASILANGEEIVCEQSDLSYKCKGHSADVEQPMHLDYPNHTLAYPPNNPKYWQTAYLIYYTDVRLHQAPTAVCSWKHYRDEILWPTSYTLEKRPELYKNEVKITVPAGSILAYSMRTFHRGTAFLSDGARIGQFVTYAPRAPRWLGIVGWAEQGQYSRFAPWIENATPDERELLGFPRPGDNYWTEETLKGVSARYPNMDMTPYR